MQIRSNLENWSMVTKSTKIKDELGAVFFVCVLLWMFLFVNALLEKCKHCLMSTYAWNERTYISDIFVIVNFVYTSKKRINPVQNKMRKYDWKCFQILERRGSWKNWWLLLVINPSRQILSSTLESVENFGAPRGTILENRINILISLRRKLAIKLLIQKLISRILRK